jgi:hypothetical protein
MSVLIEGGTSGVVADVTASKAVKTTLYDAAGNPLASIVDIAGHYHMAVTTNQEIQIDPANSSVANIANGVTWSGSLTDTLGINAIQVSVLTDRRTTVTVTQYSTAGGAAPVVTSWSVPANFGSARTVQATGSYYKTSVKNEGATPTTSVSIQSILAPILECLPRSLSSGGNLKVTQSAEWQDSHRTLGLYGLSSFRTLGDTAATQNMLTIENPVGSTILVAIRSLNYMSETLVALLTIASQIRTSRVTGMPSNGTVLAAVKYRSDYVASAAIVRGATASDGGGATAITATAGTTFWSQFLDRPATAVGNIPHPNYNLVPEPGADLRQLLLLPGEALLVQSVGALPATTHVIVNVNWLEMAY